tara:strand:+ start:1099 stop:1809 length:711 start_codon:yes stop_codon:yes gene_type:complete
MNTINVQSLTKFYGDKSALAGVNFSACDGDFIGLLGANGAGKSTLIKCLSGVLAPSDGDAFFNEYSIVRDRTYCQLKVGYLPESPSGFEDLTVTELVRLSASSHGLSGYKQEKCVAAVLEEMELGSISGLRLANLSKGLRQRAWLAQALVHNPEILFLDEPTDGLDPIQKVALRRYIRGIARKKIVIMSTHILEEAEAMCGRLLVMNNGHIVKDGATQAFLDAQGHLESSVINYAS